MAARLDFEIDSELETGLITGHAGVPGLIEAFRQTGTAAVIDREIQLKSRKRGLSPSAMVESLLALWAAGGERAEDLDQFRQDKALALILKEWTFPYPNYQYPGSAAPLYYYHISNIRGGGGAFLNGTGIKLDSTTVTFDTVPDKLQGNGPFNWFWCQTTGPAKAQTDALPGEVID